MLATLQVLSALYFSHSLYMFLTEKKDRVSTKQGIELTERTTQTVWELFTQAQLTHFALQACGSVHHLSCWADC